MNKRSVKAFYGELAKVIVPKPELDFRSAFELLIAVVLSAQCTDKAVNKVTAVLWQTVHGPADMVAMGQEKLEEAIRSIGFHHTKAAHIIGLCRELLEKHGGQVPSTHDELTALPGVGNKTANVVLNLWFGEPTIPVDTHVFRVAHRCGLSQGKTPEAVEADLVALTPHDYAKDAHHLLLLHGRYTCRARQPLCETCVVRKWCCAEEGKKARNSKD